MKKIIILIAAFIYSMNVMAQVSTADAKNVNWKHKYCAKMKEGKLMIMSEGKELTADASLENGVKIHTDGTLTKTDGTVVKLKNGECVDKDGNVVKAEMRK